MCLFLVWFDSLLDKNQGLICLDIHQNYKVVQQGKYKPKSGFQPAIFYV